MYDLFICARRGLIYPCFHIAMFAWTDVRFAEALVCQIVHRMWDKQDACLALDSVSLIFLFFHYLVHEGFAWGETCSGCEVSTTSETCIALAYLQLVAL